MLLLIHGENKYLSTEKLEKLLAKETHIIVQADEVVDLGELLASQQNYSIFGNEKQVIVLKNLSKNKKKTLMNQLVEYLAKTKDINIVIFEDTKFDARSKLYKFIKKEGIVEYNEHFGQSKMISWIASEFSKRNIQVDNKFILKMLGKAGTNEEQVMNEIEKLSLLLKYEGRNELVDLDLEVVSEGEREVVIWDLLDSVTDRNSKKTVELINEIMQTNYDFPYVSTMLAKQLKLLYLLKSRRITEDDLKTKLGIHPFTISKAKNKLYKFEEERLKKLFAKLASLDFSVKQGKIDAKLGLIMLFASA